MPNWTDGKPSDERFKIVELEDLLDEAYEIISDINIGCIYYENICKWLKKYNELD